MNISTLPWLELAIALPFVGAAVVAFVRDARHASRSCLGIATASLVCTVLAGVVYAGGSPRIFIPGLAVDEFNAPLLPLVALLHVFVALTTARTRVIHFPFAALLLHLAVRLAAFSCVATGPLILLLMLEAMLPLAELRQRGRPRRLFAIHTLLFMSLLFAGWLAMSVSDNVASVLFLAAVLVRTGALPTQVWITDVASSASFGTAILFVTPFASVYAAVRLVLPIAPEWALEALGILALLSAAYAAGMAIVQTDTRRFFAYFFVSHAAIVLVGLGLNSPLAVTGALVMWLSAAVSLAGLGLILRAVEARYGVLPLTEYRGLYDHSPALAVGFLLTGLAVVGFPGTSGFIAFELLVDEAVGAHEAYGLALVLIAALNGIAVVRVYLLLFTGCRHVTNITLTITRRERIALLTLAVLILGGGLVPQVYLENRHRAAETILRD